MIQRACTLGAILLCCFICSACEELIDPDLPFVERLVVQSTLVAGSPVDSIFIKRTQPLSARYDSAASVLTDVSGWIESDGIRYPLVHKGSSRYEAEGLVGQPGKHYMLTAEWREKKVHASTTIPAAPVIDTAYVIYQRSGPQDSAAILIEAVVPPEQIAIYAMEVYDKLDRSSGDYLVVDLNYYTSIKRYDDTLADGKVHLRFDAYPIRFTQNQAKIVVYSYDIPFYDFYYSNRNRNQDQFFGNSQPVRWNVEGDGIGIFVGRNMTTRTVP